MNSDEITFIPIFIFFRDAWRTLLIAIIGGVVISTIYLALTPTRYQADFSVYIVPLLNADQSVDNSSIERSVSRVKEVFRVNNEALIACATGSSSDTNIFLDKDIKFTANSPIVNYVNVKVTRNSPNLTRACGEVLIDLFEYVQGSMIKQYEEKLNSRLSKINQRIHEDQTFMKKISQDFDLATPTYFYLIKDIRELDDQRDFLLNSMSSVKAPVTIRKDSMVINPLHPQKLFYLLVGLFGGLFFGILIFIFNQEFIKYKTRVNEF